MYGHHNHKKHLLCTQLFLFPQCPRRHRLIPDRQFQYGTLMLETKQIYLKHNFPSYSPHPSPKSSCLIISCFTRHHLHQAPLVTKETLGPFWSKLQNEWRRKRAVFSSVSTPKTLFSKHKIKVAPTQADVTCIFREVHKARDRIGEP